MNKRELATIQKISNVQSISGYDKIDLYQIKGWQVIAGKGEFKIGELVVFIEPDTILPERPEFEFLRKRCWNSVYGGFRIRVMKLGGIYSQGIIFPLSILNKPKKLNLFKWLILFNKKTIFQENQDMTSPLGIIRYDEEEKEQLRYEKRHPQKKYFGFRKILFKLGLIGHKKRKRTKKSYFPSFFPKSDEIRLNSIPEILDCIKEKEIYISEKIDGCSSSFYYKDGEFGVCTRNMKIGRNANVGLIGSVHWACVDKYDIENKLSSYCKNNNKNIVLQGEIIAPSVQGNKYQKTEPELYLYQIYDINKQNFINYPEFIIITKDLGIPTVPILFKGNERDLNLNSVEDWIKYSIGKSIINLSIEREGIVIRTVKEEKSPGLKTINSRISFKVINPEFLLKQK